MPGIPFFCAVLLLAAALVPAVASPLAAEWWHKRIVLVFAERAGGVLEKQVETLLKERAALAERDMVVIAVAGDDVQARFGTTGAPPDAAGLRREYDVASEAAFTVILVGKDGGEKLRRLNPVAPGEIFALIDAMPMRQSEMRKR